MPTAEAAAVTDSVTAAVVEVVLAVSVGAVTEAVAA